MQECCYPVVSTLFVSDILMSKYGPHGHIRVAENVTNITYNSVLGVWNDFDIQFRGTAWWKWVGKQAIYMFLSLKMDKIDLC